MYKRQGFEGIKIQIHLNNASRAGGVALQKALEQCDIEKYASKHIQDIVSHVPPDFLGYNPLQTDEKAYEHLLHETSHKLKILSKNWHEGFVRHRLSNFLIMFTPDKLQKRLMDTHIPTPAPNQHTALGYHFMAAKKSAETPPKAEQPDETSLH